MGNNFKQFYEFGAFLLDVSGRELSRGERSVHLTPKEFDTLVALVRGAGRLMLKEELLKEIWPDTFDGDATLAQNVFTLQKALGEADGGKPYIETVPGRGYKFAAKVRERREEASTDEGHPVRGAVLIAVVAFAIVAALIYGVFRFVVRPQTENVPRVKAIR